MVYLSFNGEVLGQHEESAVPGLLAGGKIKSGSFYWREGMAEWRPITEMSQPEASKPIVASQIKPAITLPSPGSNAASKKPFLPRRAHPPGTASGATPGAMPSKLQPEARSFPAPGQTASPAGPLPAKAKAPDAAIVPAPKKNRNLLLGLGLLAILAVSGAGAWWWIANREPPVVPGNVVLNGDEEGAVEIRVFRRPDLVAPWRERLAAADARATELDGLLTAAQAQVREKSLLRDEAARVCEVGEEYNMPDVAELRADRDAKQAEADAAQAEFKKLELEKAELLTFESLFESLPAPLGTMTADPAGAFALPPPQEDVVLLATTSASIDGKRSIRAWLEVLELPSEGEGHPAVRFSETNRLDLDQIRRFASAE